MRSGPKSCGATIVINSTNAITLVKPGLCRMEYLVSTRVRKIATDYSAENLKQPRGCYSLAGNFEWRATLLWPFSDQSRFSRTK
jgi:hypothetical protein